MIKFRITIGLLLAAVFSSCSSTSDISLNSGQTSQADKSLAELEDVIIPLEALGTNEARNKIGDIAAARQLIVHMEKDSAADAYYSARVVAWSGRLAVLEGRYSEGVRLHRLSASSSPGNLPAVVLSIRLEGDPSKRLETIEKELAVLGQKGMGVGELNIERARALGELNRFSESAGAFDTAFSSGIRKVYADSYRQQRNRAWELRNSSGVDSASLSLLGRESITWNDCITLTKNETQLLRFITGGRTISDTELFSRLIEREFIPITQDITVTQWPASKPKANETLTRAGAAWFIWHLYAESRADRGMLSRYSARFATGANPRSPIADVPPLSPFFDSILGSVETELLSLPDGRNFRPAQLIRGAELLAILKRMDN
ncbi:MAG: hypothetical protein FWB77_06180 [Treponema sp.]|nr:hypothetical protein [Treponema sp.]